MDVEDLAAGEEAPPLLREELGVDTRELKLLQMLVRESLVRSEQDDPVHRPTAVQVQVVLVLEDVDVHQQRLAASGRHPEGHLVQVLPRVRLDAARLRHGPSGRPRNGILAPIEGIHVGVQLREQPVRVPEVPVEVDLSKEQCQVLEVLGIEERPCVVPPFRDPLPVPHDVLVVGQQHVVGQVRPVEEQPQVVVEAGDVVLVEALVLRGLQVGGQALEAGHPEQR